MKKIQMSLAILTVIVTGAACENYRTIYTVDASAANKNLGESEKTVLESDSEEIDALKQRITELEEQMSAANADPEDPEVAEGETETESGDVTAPAVVSLSPENAAMVDPKLQAVLVTFSEPMDYASVKLAAIIEDEGGATLPVDLLAMADTDNPSLCRNFAIVWNGHLKPKTQYSVMILKSAKDLAGNPMTADAEFYFVTAIGAVELAGF